MDCRKSSGAPFAAFAVWPMEDFEQLGGQTNTYADRTFCTTCGGRIGWLSDTEAEISIGSLDEAPTDLAPQYELWVKRREYWLNPLTGAAQFDEDRIPTAGGLK